jgi:hypothetical protein
MLSGNRQPFADRARLRLHESMIEGANSIMRLKVLALCCAVIFCAAFGTIEISRAQTSQSKGAGSAPDEGDGCASAALHWSSTESLGTREAYKDHLARFPTCAFATLAKARIAALDAKTDRSSSAATTTDCGRGETQNADGECVREHARETAPKRVLRRAATIAPAPRTGGPVTLDCSGPVGFVGCVSHALSKH